jgi:hypothetical protein
VKYMDDRWFALIGLVVASGIIWFLHWMVARHGPPEGDSDRRMVRGLEYFAMLCLFGAFLKDEVLEVLGRAQTHATFRENAYSILAALVASLVIYRVFTWKKS